MQLKKEKLKQALKKMGLAMIYIIEMKLSFKATGLMFTHELKDYNQVISDYVDTLEENKIENPVDIFNCFNQTLWNGYFSAAQSFSYDLNRKLYFDNFGLGCINGEAVCLNNADMLTDVFRSYGYDASTMICRVDTNKTILDLDGIPIERNVSPSKSDWFYKKVGSVLSYISGNHVITAVKYENDLYYFDPTNLCYLGKTENNKIEIINGNGIVHFKYLSSILIGDIDIDTLTGSANDYTDQIENSKYIDEQVLQEFYEKEKEIYERIKDGCKYKIPLILLYIFMVYLDKLRIIINNEIKDAIEYKKDIILLKSKVRKLTKTIDKRNNN